MPTDFAFRFSTYLTLLLACGCTGYAELEYLPEVSGFTGVVAVLMVVAFVCDRRGWVMSLTNANVLGGGILLLVVLWFGYHYKRSDSLMNTLPWPAGGLPYVAALMMLLVPAKLFRPKHVGDWWALQGLGISMVGVAGAMADDFGFVVLMTAYAVAGVWSLTLFYLRRSAGHVPPPPPFEPVDGLRAVFSPQTYLPRWFFVARSRPTVAEPFAGVGQPTPTERLGRSHFVRAVRWVVVGGVLTLPFFLLSPRTEGLRWELFDSRMETGVSGGAVDLGRTGELQPNPEPVFTVTVRTADDRPGVLPDDQRFRVVAHPTYQYPRGQWSRAILGRLINSSLPPGQPLPPGPDDWPDRLTLKFELEPRATPHPLADPVFFSPYHPAPIVYHSRNQTVHANSFNNGSFRINSPVDGTRLPTYWQTTRPAAGEPGAYFRIDKENIETATAVRALTEMTSHRIAQEAKRLLPRLARDGRLPAAVLDRFDPVKLLPAEDDHALVAAAFEQYFARSGVYDYTLSLRRQDRTIDPIEDFLFNTKAGHCERFASALVLMLRGVGVPCQFVIGYRGCEQVAEGKYLVRQDHAHAWAEALVSRPAADGNGREWYWQSLDPTAASIDADAKLDGLANTGKQGNRLFSLFITGLTPETQKQLIQDAQDFGQHNGLYLALVGVLLLLCGVWAVRDFRRPPAAAPPAAPEAFPWFGRLADLLGRHGHPLQGGQTPAEFAASATAWLAARPQTRAVADVPTGHVDVLDRSRYAGRPLTREDTDGMSRDFARLREALESAAGTPS